MCPFGCPRGPLRVRAPYCGAVRTRTALVLSALLALGIAVPVAAQSSGGPIAGPATASSPAVPVTPLASDVVTIYNSGDLRGDVATAAMAAARQGGAGIAFGRSASVGMVGLYRASAPVQLPAAGFAYPMGTTVLPPEVVSSTMGRDVAQHLAADAAVMGQTSASLRGAQAGDTMHLLADNGSVVAVRIGAVLPDAKIGGSELLMSPQAGDRLGIVRLSRAVLWNPSSRAALDNAMAANGLVSTSVRIRRSWDPPDPDDTLGVMRTKALLGEFSYRVNSNGWLTLDSTWMRNITYGSIGGLSLASGCHKDVRPALAAAMNELSVRGVAGTINYSHANSAGGCFGARFNRLTPSSSLGFVSRHSWGMAVDTNTVGSCQGCVPDFIRIPGGCTAVQIFRKHGFAWGGNYLTPDGMHFEYVGERRDLLPYPSRWCANTGAVALTTAEAGIDTFFASDGMIVEH